MKRGGRWGDVRYFEPCDLINQVDQMGNCLPCLWWQINGEWWQTGGDGGFFEYAVEGVVGLLSWLRVPRFLGVIKGEWGDVVLWPEL